MWSTDTDIFGKIKEVLVLYDPYQKIQILHTLFTLYFVYILCIYYTYPCMKNIVFLSEFCSIWDRFFRYCEYHRAIFSVKPCAEKLTHKWTNLFRWKIHNSNDLFSDEFEAWIVGCDLGARAFDADFWTKIHPDLVGRFSSLGKILGTNDSASTELYGFKFWPSYRRVHSGGELYQGTTK